MISAQDALNFVKNDRRSVNQILAEIEEKILVKSSMGGRQIGYNINRIPADTSLEVGGYIEKAGYMIEYDYRNNLIIINW